MQIGDPTAAGPALLKIVDADTLPLRVFFGTAGLALLPPVYAERLKTWQDWAHVSVLPGQPEPSGGKHPAADPRRQGTPVTAGSAACVAAGLFSRLRPDPFDALIKRDCGAPAGPQIPGQFNATPPEPQRNK
ncbi:hypothetical protein ABZ330_36260 [Streptomyces sp. NPDC006172]|uniref:hypothetical protein n=1 Tax=Streptomyces sp. NPDC006172 TaxID=3154470 RepID=UPI0033F07041